MSEHEEVADAWAEDVSAPAGRLLPEAEAVLRTEPADLGRNFETADPDWHGRRIRRLGAAPFRGRLVAFGPGGSPGRPLRFPVEVEEGVYPAYVLEADERDLLVVRLGGGRPATWREVCSEDGSDAFFPIEAAIYAVADEATYDAILRDSDVRAAADDLSRGPDGSAALSGHPNLGMVVCNCGGDQQAWGYVGLTAAGDVAAVAVALVTDCVYRYRPASEDARVIAACRTLVADLPVDDPDEDEILSYRWPVVLKELEETGRLSGDGRNTLYEVYEALRT